MQGHIQRRGDSWRVTAYLGRDDSTGKKRYAQRTVRGTKSDAQSTLARLVTEVNDGRYAFTDIEGSTGLWESAPEAMQVALQRHDELLRSAIESARGYVFKTVGDAFCAAFASARDDQRGTGTGITDGPAESG
jgi:class 3 adenylate cyclase